MENKKRLKTELNYDDKAQLLNQIGSPIAPRQDGIQLRLAKTARKGKSRRITYTKRSGQLKLFNIQRYSFRSYRGIIYFYGWDLDDLSIKSFISNNISNVVQLDIPHKRYWIVQMGNDPQQIKYWQKQNKKTPRQKAAQQIVKTAQKQGTDATKEVTKTAEQVVDQVQQMMQPQVDEVGLQIRAFVQPIIKTIKRNSSYITPKGPTGATGPTGPTIKV